MILPADGCSAQEVFEPSLADALQALLLQMLRSATLLAEKALASQEIRRTLAAAEHTLSQLLRLQIVGPANRLSCPQPASDGQTRALVDDKSGGEALIAEDVDSRASDAGRAHAQLRATLGLALRELLHSLLPRLPRPVGEANRLLAALVEALGNGVPQASTQSSSHEAKSASPPPMDPALDTITPKQRCGALNTSSKRIFIYASTCVRNVMLGARGWYEFLTSVKALLPHMGTVLALPVALCACVRVSACA
eukprot:6178110-Pleurochrysis_carterae.AAC.6